MVRRGVRRTVRMPPRGAVAPVGWPVAWPATPPAVGPWCRRNFIPRRPNFRKKQTGLPDPNPKPTPAWLGGAIARSNATPLPGRLPLGQRADGPPSRRVTEPTSRRARKRQEFEPPSSAPTPRTAQDAPRECEVRTAPCPGFRLLSSPTHSHAWPFAVARATQVCRRNHNQSGTVWRAIALARSDHPAATGESDPSVTLPRTSPPAIVWYQQAPIIQSDPAIGVTDTSASRAWVHVGQPAPKTALKASHKALYRPEECLGSHGARPRQRGLVTNRHKSSCHVTILRFWPAISEPGWARRKKVSLGVLLRRTRPSHGRVLPKLDPPEARQNFLLAGLCTVHCA